VQRVSYQFKGDVIRNTSICAGFGDVRNLTLAMRFHSVFVAVRKAWICLGKVSRNGGSYVSQISLEKTFCIFGLILTGRPIDGFPTSGLRRDVCLRTSRAPILDISTAWSRALQRPACAKNRRSVCRSCPPLKVGTENPEASLRPDQSTQISKEHPGRGRDGAVPRPRQ
jgi:hypothetical protein